MGKDLRIDPEADAARNRAGGSDDDRPRSRPEEALQGLGDYPSLGKAAAADIPGSRLVELPNVGHLPQLGAPDRFRAAVLEFLGSAR